MILLHGLNAVNGMDARMEQWKGAKLGHESSKVLVKSSA